MNNENHIETTLLSSSLPYISRHVNIPSIIISLVLMGIGIASILFALDVEMTSPTFSMLLLSAGTVCLIFALYRLFWKSKGKVYTPTGSSVVEGSCYWDSCELQHLTAMLEQSDFKLDKHLSAKLSGNVRLDYILSKDRKFAAVQLFQFVPYVYEPVTNVFYYTEEIASNFAKYIVKNKY